MSRALKLVIVLQFLLTGYLVTQIPDKPVSQQTTYYKTIAGTPGPIGTTGVTGLTGLAGLPGQAGGRGLEGLQGIPGSPGPRGETGETGPQGEQGPAGQNGEDAPTYQIRKNPQTGDLEGKYSNDTDWNLLYKKCEIQGTCDGS